jgi:hypothetical protein
MLAGEVKFGVVTSAVLYGPTTSPRRCRRGEHPIAVERVAGLDGLAMEDDAPTQDGRLIPHERTTTLCGTEGEDPAIAEAFRNDPYGLGESNRDGTH